MSVQTQIDRIRQNVSDAFAAVESKGGTVPASPVSDDLAEAIGSILAGSELNFSVVGNPKPNNPLENTVWVNTDEPVTGYYFSGTQPESMLPGSVWILTGASGSVEFNALRNNSIQLRPVSVKQYINSELVSKGCQIRKGDEWKPLWTGELYGYGDEYLNTTGGWNIVGCGAKSDTSMRVGADASHATETPDALITAKAIDFAGYSKVEAHFVYFQTSSSIGEVRLDLVNESGEVVVEAKWTTNKASDFTMSVDIPTDGRMYYVQIASRHGPTSKVTYADFDYVRAVI